MSANMNKYVTIGSELCNLEEYLGDSTTTYIEDGKIFAATPGFIQIDVKNRTIRVDNKTEKKRNIPQKGDTVIIMVDVIRKHSAGCTIFKLNHKLIESGVIGNIHVSNMSKRYIENIFEAFQKTDIVRAQVVGREGRELKLSTSALNAGVIQSQCKYCGTMLVRKNRDQLSCNFCGNTERRIIAPDYGMTNEMVTF
jgi:exosome complex component CSL4